MVVAKVDSAEGAARRTPAGASALGEARVAGKVLAVGGKSLDVLEEGLLELVALFELKDLVLAGACGVGTSAKKNLDKGGKKMLVCFCFGTFGFIHFCRSRGNMLYACTTGMDGWMELTPPISRLWMGDADAASAEMTAVKVMAENFIVEVCYCFFFLEVGLFG